ncbi:Gfo/Idh/MocA family protein [Arthrobacter sp. MDT1-48-3]
MSQSGPVERSPSAKPVGWGVIGTGDVSRTIAPDFTLATGSRRAAVASRDADRAAQFAHDFAFERSHGNIEDLLEDPGIDAVYIATPHGTHREIALRALLAGKHVLVEKPIALNAEEAREIFQTASELGLFAMEAMWMKFGNCFRRMMKDLDAGVVGEVRSVRASFGIPFPTDRGSRWSAELGGSTLLDQGIYSVTLALMLLGTPREIIVRGSMRDDGVDLAEHVTLEFDDGKYAQIAASMVDFVDPSASINGTTGWISVPWPFWASPNYAVHSGASGSLHNPDIVHLPPEGNGFRPMIHTVNEVIAKGAIKCDLHLPQQTIVAFEIMDEIRRQLRQSQI